MQNKVHQLSILVEEALHDAGISIDEAHISHQNELKALILKYLKVHNPCLMPTKQRGLSAKKLNAVFSYIDSNIKSNITLKNLSSIANMSEFHFCRLFSEQMKITPLQYVNKKRLERAKQLLGDEKKAVTWVCYELGYKSASHFSNKFKRYTGVTPSEYRKSVYS